MGRHYRVLSREARLKALPSAAPKHPEKKHIVEICEPIHPL